MGVCHISEIGIGEKTLPYQALGIRLPKHRSSLNGVLKMFESRFGILIVRIIFSWGPHRVALFTDTLFPRSLLRSQDLEVLVCDRGV